MKRSIQLISPILILVLLAGCTTMKSIQEDRDRLAQQFSEQVKPAKESAEKVYGDRQDDFPKHYALDISQQRQAALDAFTNINGSENQAGWLAELDSAIEKKDKKVAKERLGWIENGLTAITVYTELVLGPPGTTEKGYFDQLDKKINLLDDGYVIGDQRSLETEVASKKDATRTIIESGEKFPICGITDLKISYVTAWNNYNAAVAGLDRAQDLQKKTELFVEDYSGQKIVDLPALSDTLVTAGAAFDNAAYDFTLVQTDNGQMTRIRAAYGSFTAAWNAALGAQSDADKARDSIWNIGAYYREDSDKAYTNGTDSLTEALKSCTSELFSQAQTQADKAKSYFVDAEYQVNRAAPTPVPTSEPAQSSPITIITIPEDNPNPAPSVDTTTYNNEPTIDIGTYQSDVTDDTGLYPSDDTTVDTGLYDD